MPLPKLALLPDTSGYSVQDGQDVIAIELDGGAGRYIRDKFGSTSRVAVSWTLLPYQHEYLRAFYNTVTQKGSLPFLCDLILDDPTPIEHVCRIVPGTMSLGQQEGYAYTSSATFEVEPITPDEELDEALVELFPYYEGDYSAFNLLAELVNENLADAL
jgi:hypothetical protein